jgi:curved DNA-binding protein CbpA
LSVNRTTLDPYATLGVPRGASERQVQQAYRRLARRYHPDLHPDAKTTEPMQRVNQAWEILSSPTRRASYDAESASRESAGGGHWSASRRRGSMSSASTTWNGTWASPPPTARTYSSAGSRPFDDGDGPGWAGAVLMVAIGLVAFVALFAGILPFPLTGIALLVLVRGVFGRFDEGGR